MIGAINFLKDFNLLCSSHQGCEDCPMGRVKFCHRSMENTDTELYPYIIEIVTQAAESIREENGKDK